MIKSERGFTLIEILIVVAIIAILASVVLVGLGPTQQAGRDARRVSDLQEVQNGLELYYNRCGIYPGSAACATAGAPAWDAFKTVLTGASIGINNVPKDPSSGRSYNYGANTGNTAYIIAADMENTNGSVFNNYTAPDTTGITFGGGAAGLTVATDCTGAGFYCVTL